MIKTKRTKGQRLTYKTLNKKLNLRNTNPHKNGGYKLPLKFNSASLSMISISSSDS